MVAALFTCALPGCDMLGGRGVDEARLVLEGTSGNTVLLVTSTRFESTNVVGGSAIVDLVDADSARVTLPFDRTYDIEERGRFYALVIRENSEGDNLHMRGYVDGELRYNNRATTDQDTLRFVYVYQGLY